MTSFSKEIVIVLGAGAAAALITATTWYQYNKRKNKIPEKWMEVGSVGDLFIYPLKSGRAVEVKEVECTKTGPVFFQENKLPLKDRFLIVYKEKNGEFRNAKNYPKLVLITVTAISDDEIRLDAPEASPLTIKTSIESPKLVSCSLWCGEPQKCIDCGSEAAKWISQYCSESDSGLRLGICADWQRTVTLEPLKILTKVYDKLKSEDLGIYSDLASYMIFNRSSLQDLNEKLNADVSPLNFRPNIVIEGPEAFAEDHWDWIKIGEGVVFRNVKPCTRCTIVNLDPEIAVPVPGQAILKKLREYRLVTDKKRREIEGNSPAMGIYAGNRKPGHIKVGDKVYVG